MAQSKKAKATVARKNAEAQKALKKETRTTKGTSTPPVNGKKGPSTIKSKAKKK